MTGLGLAAALPFNQTKGDPLLSLGPVFAIRAKDSVEGEQWALNKGTGGQVLRAKYGSVARAEIRRGIGLICPGASGNYAEVPDSPGLSITGDLDIIVCAALDNWANGSVQGLLAKVGSSPATANLSYALYLTGLGELQFQATDGVSATDNRTSSVNLSSTAKGSMLFVRVLYNTVATRFYTCTDGISWAQLGTSQPARSITLVDTVESVRFGQFGVVGSPLPMAGVILSAQIWSGNSLLSGTKQLDVDFTQQNDFTTSFTCTTGQTVTVTAANAVDTNDPTLLKQSNTSYVYLPGTAGDADRINTSSLTTGASNVYDIRVLADLDSMTPSSDRTLFSYTASDPNRSIRWYLETTGKLIAEVTPTGSIASFISMASSTTVGASGKLWFRVTVEGNVAGSYRTRFYRCDGNIVSPTVSDWIQIGSDITGAGFTFATCTATWGTVGTAALQGKWYRATLATSIDGAPLIDLSASNIVDPTLTTFTCTTGQTCSIGRSAAGRKTVVVTQPVWLLGTDDYLEVLDNDLLDFNNIDHTVLVITRWWDTAITYGAIVVKNQTAPFNDGWTLAQNNGSGIFPMYFEDEVGSFDLMGCDNAATQGQLFLFAGIREGTVNKNYVNNTMTSVSAPDVSDLRNSGVMRIGSTPFNAYYADMELFAVYIFRKALTAAEIAAGVQYWNAA